MKLKKIKLKKKQPNRSSNAKPKETSKIILVFIIVTALLFLVVGFFIFGIWVAIPFTILYLLMIWLVRTIDKYPIGSRTVSYTHLTLPTNLWV